MLKANPPRGRVGMQVQSLHDDVDIVQYKDTKLGEAGSTGR